MKEGSYILSSNLITALYDAIDHARERELAAGFSGMSAYRAALLENLEYLRENQTLKIIDNE